MKAISIITVALASLVALLPSVALSESATPISECAYGQSYGPTIWYEGHRDIENGFVMYTRRMDEDGSGTMFVADCFSGSTLLVDYEKNDAKKVQKFVLRAAASAEKWTLSKFREHFSASGSWTSLDVQDTEHCACAAFYPEAKGEKADWQARLGHP